MSDQHDERAVMPSESVNDAVSVSEQRDSVRRSALSPASTVDAGAQHPAENTATPPVSRVVPPTPEREVFHAVAVALWDMQSAPDCWCDSRDAAAPTHSIACAQAQRASKAYCALTSGSRVVPPEPRPEEFSELQSDEGRCPIGHSARLYSPPSEVFPNGRCVACERDKAEADLCRAEAEREIARQQLASTGLAYQQARFAADEAHGQLAELKAAILTNVPAGPHGEVWDNIAALAALAQAHAQDSATIDELADDHQSLSGSIRQLLADRAQLEALRAALRDTVERWRGDADLSSLRLRAEIFRRCANDVDAAVLALHGGKE